VLPLGDLAVRRGIASLYGNGEEISRAETRSVAEAWRPYRSHGSRYVWAAHGSDGGPAWSRWILATTA